MAWLAQLAFVTAVTQSGNYVSSDSRGSADREEIGEYLRNIVRKAATKVTLSGSAVSRSDNDDGGCGDDFNLAELGGGNLVLWLA